MRTSTQEITFFILITTGLIFLLALVVMGMIYLYQKRNYMFQVKLETIKNDHAKNLLQTQIEIQEQTFMNISREIHDNINLSLTLAKLNLNTILWNDLNSAELSVKESIGIISCSINDLSDISKSMNSDLINSLGLIKAIENEITRVKRITNLEFDFTISGEPVFLDSEFELIIYRIIQEGFNNIIKHAKASHIQLNLHYTADSIYINVKDNGIGFDKELVYSCREAKAGLRNMENRAKLLNGTIFIDSMQNIGTSINITLPLTK